MTNGARVPLKNIKIEQQALFFTQTVRYTIHKENQIGKR